MAAVCAMLFCVSSFLLTNEDPLEKWPQTVVLDQRSGGKYEKSAYSFRYRTGDPQAHRNYVDLVFGPCGQLHFNVHSGQKNAALVVTGEKLAEVKAVPEAREWLRNSLEPVVGKIVVQRITTDDFDKPLYVKYQITKVEDQKVTIIWQPLNEEQADWPPLDPPRGAAGTAGLCGGPHPEK